jgi:hypothetical protein
MNPTPEEFRAALHALRSDAQIWADSAVETRLMAISARECQVAPEAFSLLGSGLAEEYRQLQEKLAGLLEGGCDVLVDVSDSLVAAATTYEAEETRGVHRMKRVW